MFQRTHRLFLYSLRLSILGLFAAVLSSQTAKAQLNSNSATVALTATLAETLGVSATPASLNFTLVPGGTAAGSAPVAITTSWVVNALRGQLNLYAWFATPSAALTDGASTPNNIPSSELYASTPNGIPTSFTAFTQSNALGVAGGGLKLFSQSLLSTNRESSRTDNVSLQINLTSQPQLPAGSYSGTLNLQVQAL